MKHYEPIDINNDEISINSQKRGYYKFGDQQQYNQLIYQSQDSNEKVYLYCDNLPIIGQIPTLYFTEYGNIYSTAILNLINDDPELQAYRKNKQISCEDFYDKLNNYYIELTKPDYDFSILNEMHVLLMRSIDSEKFMPLDIRFLRLTLKTVPVCAILTLQLAVLHISRLTSVRRR